MSFKQGDIVLVNLNPIKGHEQGNQRPVLVINQYLMPGDLNVVLPITSADQIYPLEVSLDARTATQGNILCFQIRTLDLNSRKARFLEKIPDDLLKKTIEYTNRLIEFIPSISVRNNEND